MRKPNVEAILNAKYELEKWSRHVPAAVVMSHASSRRVTRSLIGDGGEIELLFGMKLRPLDAFPESVALVFRDAEDAENFVRAWEHCKMSLVAGMLLESGYRKAEL